MKTTLSGRIAKLETRLLPRLLIRDLTAGRRKMQDLTDEELKTLIAELDRLDPEAGRLIDAMSDDELRTFLEA